MNAYLMLAKGHGGMAMLLTLVMVGLLALSALAAMQKDSFTLSKPAKILTLIQTILIGIVGATGIVAAFMGPYPLSSGWMWVGFVAVGVISVLAKRMVKPAWLPEATNQDRSKAFMVEIVLFVLFLGAYALMMLKPF